jgi:hypothetical protein
MSTTSEVIVVETDMWGQAEGVTVNEKQPETASTSTLQNSTSAATQAQSLFLFRYAAVDRIKIIQFVCDELFSFGVPSLSLSLYQ